MSTKPKEKQNYLLVYCRRCEQKLVYSKNFPKPGERIKPSDVLDLKYQAIAGGTRMPDCKCGPGAKWRNHARCELVQLGIEDMPVPFEQGDIETPTSNYFV